MRESGRVPAGAGAWFGQRDELEMVMVTTAAVSYFLSP